MMKNTCNNVVIQIEQVSALKPLLNYAAIATTRLLLTPSSAYKLAMMSGLAINIQSSPDLN